MLDGATLAQDRQSTLQLVASVLQVPLYTAGLLLSHVKWNTNALVAKYLANPQQLCEDAGVPSPQSKVRSVPPSGTEVTELLCESCICEESSDNMYALACGHQFCLDCWEQYLNVALEIGMLWFDVRFASNKAHL